MLVANIISSLVACSLIQVADARYELPALEHDYEYEDSFSDWGDLPAVNRVPPSGGLAGQSATKFNSCHCWEADSFGEIGFRLERLSRLGRRVKH